VLLLFNPSALICADLWRNGFAVGLALVLPVAY